MPSGRRKFLVRHPVVVDIGCSCRRPKLPSFFSFSQKPKPPKSPSLLSPSTTISHWENSLTTAAATSTTTATATNSSPSRHGDYTSPQYPASYPPESPQRAAARGQRKPYQKKKKHKCPATAAAKMGVVEGSMAVVKESSDPYLDFRDSMLQMIVEMEIYAWEDLRDLLHRFLALNAPRHHHLILRAFAEILNGLFSPP
ncbi:DUF623 domain containing protein [Musa troglodytarum]|uniref:Transcription repressor n=1 Tax=Musa troglodytarum TaxID=320322 RepID=A0A9E7HFU7_9LILI|nr:DUF623 domain containing protein [Musa troglodytarum]